MYCSAEAYNTPFSSLLTSVWYEGNQSMGQHSTRAHFCFAMAWFCQPHKELWSPATVLPLALPPQVQRQIIQIYNCL